MDLKKLFLYAAILFFPLYGDAEENFELPQVCQAYPWVNFCSKHLCQDSEGCSSWTLRFKKDGEKCICPEENHYFLFPYSSISPELVDRFKNQGGFNVIPTLPGTVCDYGYCNQCHRRLIRTLIWDVIRDWDEEEECYSESFVPLILYKCDCVEDFIDKNDEEYCDLVAGWTFCNEPACFSGYFDSHISTYFSNFCSFASYCCENADCDCYWLEKTKFRKKILDLIEERLWKDLLRGGICFGSNFTCIDYGLKLVYVPLRKFMEHIIHSVFYTDLKDSLREFDRMVFCTSCEGGCLDSRISQIKWDTFYQDLIFELRPLFLEEYKSCYSKHPHPKIAAEIKIILDEMEQEGEPRINPVKFDKESQQSPLFIRNGQGGFSLQR